MNIFEVDFSNKRINKRNIQINQIDTIELIEKNRYSYIMKYEIGHYKVIITGYKTLRNAKIGLKNHIKSEILKLKDLLKKC